MSKFVITCIAWEKFQKKPSTRLRKKYWKLGKDVSIGIPRKLSARATDIFIEVAGSIVQKTRQADERQLSHNDVDVIVSVDNDRRAKLFVFDMDSTLIYQEVIELITAAYAGVEEQWDHRKSHEQWTWFQRVFKRTR